MQLDILEGICLGKGQMGEGQLINHILENKNYTNFKKVAADRSV